MVVRFPTLLCLLITLCPFVSAAPTTAPADTNVDTNVDTLITQLSSDDGPTRRRAQERLIQIGPAAENALRNLIKQNADEEAVARATAALGAIAENRHIGPTLVSLHHHGAHPQAVLADLAAQSGYAILPDPPELWASKEWPKVNLDLDRAPFWTALLDLCRQLGLEPDVADAGRITLTNTGGDPDWALAPAVVSGPLLVQATDLTVTRSVRLGKPANAEQSCTLALTVYAEPKLRILHEGCSATIEAAFDEHRTSLLTEESKEIALAGGGRLWDMELPLSVPPQTSRKIAELRGTLNLVVPVRIESAEFSDVTTARNVSRAPGGRRLVFRRLRKLQGGWEVQVSVFRDALDDDQWQQLTNPTDFVKLVDDKGKAFAFSGVTGNDDATDKQATVTLRFDAPLAVAPGANADSAPAGIPAKFTWEVPLQSRELRLPFAFHDLQLP